MLLELRGGEKGVTSPNIMISAGEGLEVQGVVGTIRKRSYLED
jgi:hypothetical protein